MMKNSSQVLMLTSCRAVPWPQPMASPAILILCKQIPALISWSSHMCGDQGG